VNYERARRFCAQLPAVTQDIKWGADLCFLVGAKMFSIWGRSTRGRSPSREALAKLPVLRKSDLPAMQKKSLPFGGSCPSGRARFGRLFTSPGPDLRAGGARGRSVARFGARALRDGALRPGDIVLNTFSYHMTPGGFIMDGGARALGCP
jgi:phenylacetate-CoA ligase